MQKIKVFSAQIIQNDNNEVYRTLFGHTEDDLHLDVQEALMDYAQSLGYEDTTSEGFENEYHIIYAEGYMHLM